MNDFLVLAKNFNYKNELCKIIFYGFIKLLPAHYAPHRSSL